MRVPTLAARTKMTSPTRKSRRPGCRTISVVQESRLTHGSSTKVWPQPRHMILCSRNGRLWSNATSLKYRIDSRSECLDTVAG
jgi:hypothetical protein